MLRRALALLALVAVAGCGGGDARAGDASTSAAGGDGAAVWITRDRGTEVILTAEVPSGVTAIEALDHVADVETRYGGRFVHSVNGIEGSLAQRRDWFYLVNGIEPNVGGAEVTLRRGDVAWWDYRAWAPAELGTPVVAVGALPEPFLHGWEGRRRPALVTHPDELAREADALLEMLGGPDGRGRPNVFVLAVEDAAAGARLSARRGPANDAPVTFTLAGSLDAVRAAAAALAREPSIVRFRYEAEFDAEGRVVG